MNETIKIKMIDHYFFSVCKNFTMNGFPRTTTKQDFWEKIKQLMPVGGIVLQKLPVPKTRQLYQKPGFVSSNCYNVTTAVQKNLMSMTLNITM